MAIRLIHPKAVLPSNPEFNAMNWNKPRDKFRSLKWLIMDVPKGQMVVDGITNNIRIKVPKGLIKCIGIYVSPYSMELAAPQGIVGYLICHVNGKRSNPVQLPVEARYPLSQKRKWDVYKLDEDLVGGTLIQAEFRSTSPGSNFGLKVYLKCIQETPKN